MSKLILTIVFGFTLSSLGFYLWLKGRVKLCTEVCELHHVIMFFFGWLFGIIGAVIVGYGFAKLII